MGKNSSQIQSFFRTEKAKKITNRRRNPISRYYKKNLFSLSSISRYYPVESNRPQFIRAPKEFSLTLNTEGMIRFFMTVDKKIRTGRPVYLDMANITVLHEDAILYLISRLDYYELININASIQGNLPNYEPCRILLLQSGFLKYVQTNITQNAENDNIFPIHEGSSADGPIVSEVINFVKRFINFKDYAERFYGPIMECIINTGAHAYSKNASYSKWWMIAIPNNNNKTIHFTVLDNGYGIPNTVRKNYAEIIMRQFGKLNYLSTGIDNKLIVSGLIGEFRTRSGLDHRGKGLPSIFELTTIPYIDNLRVISSHGYVLTGSNLTILESVNLRNKFHGTLISWDFIKIEDISDG